MITYRPAAPLTVGPRKGWKPALAAVVMVALLGTTSTAALAAEPATQQSSVQSLVAAAPGMPAVEPARRES